MKKRYIIIIIIALIITTIASYLIISKLDNNKTDKYDQFVHANLTGKTAIYYVNPNGSKDETYAMVDLTPTPYEAYRAGFYYKVGEDDFILLKTFETSDPLSSLGFFENDKYYGVNDFEIGSFIINLNKENSTFEKLRFNYNNTEIFPLYLKNLSNNMVEVHTIMFEDNHNISKEFECSLIDYSCKLNEE